MFEEFDMPQDGNLYFQSVPDVEETVHTYQKVMEVRELTQDEILKMNKWRLFLKKLFEVFFRNKKWRVYYTVFVVRLLLLILLPIM